MPKTENRVGKTFKTISMKKLYLLILVFTLIQISCKKDKEEPPVPNEQFEINYANNNLVVPSDASIIFDGQQYQGNVSIPKNKLVGIIKNNKAYLYFTGMGSANLNDSTSRRAVGYYMFSSDSTTKSSKSLDLTTGIRIEQNGTQFKFTNLKKRFAAVECQNNTDYLFQRGEVWPDINWIGALKGENLISILEYDNTTFSNIIQANTYGASIRLLTLPVGPLSWAIIAQKNLEALNSGANSSILVNVNFIDFSYFTLKGVNEIVGALPVPFLDCWAAYVTNAAGNTLHSVLTELLTHDDHISKQNWQNFTNDLLNDFFTCLVSNGIEATGIGMPVKQFLDIVSSGQWIIDNTLISSIDIITCSVFEAWSPSGNWDLFKKTINNYSETDNLEQAVVNEFGSNYRIADWNDVVSYCQTNSPEQFINNLNWQLGEENSFMVIWNGQHFYNNGTRHFYISRFDHNKPSHYLAHDNIDNHHIDLGSWYGLNMPILCVKN